MSDSADLPDGIGPASTPEPGDSDPGPYVLTPEQRTKFLGRLADFELRLGDLTEMQANFVLAVLGNPTNYTLAATRAGYKSPKQDAQNLLHNPRIAACIAAGEQLREDRTYLTSDRTMHEFAIIAFSDVNDFVVENGKLGTAEGVPAYATRAVSSVEWDEDRWLDEEGRWHTRTKTKLRLWNKVDALKMIAMYQRLLSGENGSNLGGIAVDRSVHIHQHQHNTWVVGDNKLTF